jgi:signal transduction histidine kinase
LAVGVMADENRILLATLPPTPGQRRLVLTVLAVLFAAFLVATPLAFTPLPHLDAFIPCVGAIIFVTDLITSVLLYAQFSIYRSPALLALASGYLFTGLIVVPHALTFPGAFSPAGLLGAGLQTAGWLYPFWHIGFPLSLLVYALLKDQDQKKTWTLASTHPAIALSAAGVVIAVCALVLLTTAGDEYMPRVLLDRAHNAPLARYVLAVDVSTCVLALVLLWSRRRSLLDQWLMVVAAALVSELVLGGVIEPTRFSLGWYFGRGYALVTSTVVLMVLLSETTRLYARLARANVMLARERDNKLMNAGATAAAIAHELKQPLAAMVANADASLAFLEHKPPNLAQAKEALNDIVADGHHAGDALDGVRTLFRNVKQAREPIDVNELAREVLHSMRGELNEHGVMVQTELAPGFLPIRGIRGQLQQVIVNLAHNAVEAMLDTSDRSRVLRLVTQLQDRDRIVVALQDTGPGIDPKRLDEIFDAFVTTKPQGTGLGLAICRVIIERHGGELTAFSDGKTGALFQFSLPIELADDRDKSLGPSE